MLESLRKAGIDATMDVHLMVKPVDRLIGDFLSAGADIISVHPEATEHLHRTLSLIREGGAKAGLVFNPATPIDPLAEVIDLVDLVLIMSVNPGFGGQAFIPASLTKVANAGDDRRQRQRDPPGNRRRHQGRQHRRCGSCRRGYLRRRFRHLLRRSRLRCHHRQDARGAGLRLKTYDGYLFDLDGTLIDTAPDINVASIMP